MICFVHADRAAVGICKSCSKGLCAECAVDLGHGLACKGVHEKEVETLSAMVLRFRGLARVSGLTRLTMPIFYLFFGAIFLGTAIAQKSSPYSFNSLIGIGFLLFGLWWLFANLKAKE